MQITDRRQMPRYPVCLNAILTTGSAHACSIKILDISSSGLSFQIKAEEVPRIIATDIQENRLSPISILLEIELQEPDMKVLVSKLKIQCGIVYLQRKNLELSIIGARFESFYENANEQLEKYLLRLKNKPCLKIT